MSFASSAFTVEEIDAQIANIKEQLLASNASYSISPADGGAGRSVTRNQRDQLNKELTLWLKRRRALTSPSGCGFRVKRAVFPRR